VYGLAARAFLGRPGAAVEAAYWFITGGAGFARKGYAVTDDIVRLVGGRVGAIVDGIGAGTFPHYPTETSSSPFVVCPYCDPDSLGVADLRRAWMRKRSDPAMGPFADLVVADG
jgi:hypothetical protein